MDFENHRFDHNVYSIGAIFINILKLVYKKSKGYISIKGISYVIHFYLIISLYGLRKSQLCYIFCTFKANFIKLYVLVPIKLNRKLKVISRATCRVTKKQFTRLNFSYVVCLIKHLVHVFSGERSRAIMALLLCILEQSLFKLYVTT